MPAPTAVVVFADIEGDEFPVRVGTPSWAADEEATISAAERAADRLIAEGSWRPEGKLHVVRIERG